jgi:hypothetical protein
LQFNPIFPKVKFRFNRKLNYFAKVFLKKILSSCSLPKRMKFEASPLLSKGEGNSRGEVEVGDIGIQEVKLRFDFIFE